MTRYYVKVNAEKHFQIVDEVSHKRALIESFEIIKRREQKNSRNYIERQGIIFNLNNYNTWKFSIIGNDEISKKNTIIKNIGFLNKKTLISLINDALPYRRQDYIYLKDDANIK